MKLISIEPTPSPHSMKITVDTRLPDGVRRSFTSDQADQAPDELRQLLQIDGVKGLFQVADFIAVDRDPRADWQTVLYQIRQLLGDEQEKSGTDGQSVQLQKSKVVEKAEPAPGEVRVYIQMFRDIPMQVKLLSGIEEIRVGVPERFVNIVMEAQKASPNVILERKWVEQGIRYGDPDEIGKQVVEELEAAYPQQRLNELLSYALQSQPSTNRLSSEQIREMLSSSDWKTRYAALQQMTPDMAHINLLEKAVRDPHVSVRRLAVAYLGELDDSRVLPMLFEALRDPAFIIRRTAGDALSDLGDPAAIGPMIEALKDENKLVRWRAAMFLYEVGDESAIPALREAENDPEFEVRMQIKMALERIEGGQEAKGSVWKQMTEAVGNPSSEQRKRD